MSIQLEPLIESYVHTMNARDVPAFLANFAPEAIVQDEGRQHHGTAQIAAWIEEAHRQYQPIFEVEQVTETTEETVLTGMVSGSFDGSPVRLHHHLKIGNGRVVSLRIEA